MNSLLSEKVKSLEDSKDYECWYFIKQPCEFDKLCYLVSFLEAYKNTPAVNLQDYIENRIEEFNKDYRHYSISKNYRALRAAAFFGLIDMNDSDNYENASISDTYYEVRDRCAGQFERTSLYKDIIERQIEKIYLSSELDKECNSTRSNYRLFPIMLLYKVLLEMQLSVPYDEISLDEYRYFLATTETYQDFLETLINIKLYRESENQSKVFEPFKAKFDNRFLQVLKQLPTVSVSSGGISLNSSRIDDVAEKVHAFETNHNVYEYDPSTYSKFLCSRESLIDLGNKPDNDFTISYTEENAIDITDTDSHKIVGANTLLYGVPGSGKSWTIQNEYCHPGSIVERLVFHPDYTYSDFIGQIMPDVSDEGSISYKFVPGPFTRIIRDAHLNPNRNFVLIIEELNRGNAPAIFGDTFQLLDRVRFDDTNYSHENVGRSEYGITNPSMAKIIYGSSNHKVFLPSNLSLVATMNTSDQNVFTLDTAFQRRWDMRLIENNFSNVDSSLASAEILDTGVTWKKFCTVINQVILETATNMISSEDKRLGAYFVHTEDLKYDDRISKLNPDETEVLKKNKSTLSKDERIILYDLNESIKQNKKFPEKVLKYLWDDAFKFNRETLFDVSSYQSLEEVINAFIDASEFERFKIFNEDIKIMLEN